MVNPPTERQLAVLKFWNNFRIENGYQPSLQEICSHFSFRAKGAASGHLKALERKGIIERTPKKKQGNKINRVREKTFRGKFMKRILLTIILLSISLTAQTDFFTLKSFRTRTFLQSEINSFERAHEFMFSLRPVLTSGKLFVMSGGELHIGTTGRYDLTSRSFSTAGLHLGIAAAYEVSKHYKFGVFIRREMQFAMDLPPGPENRVIESIVEDWKKRYPNSRMLYYNHYGFIVFAEDENGKLEIALHSPFKIPVLHTVPQNTPVAWLFIAAEVLLPHHFSLKLDWTFHALRPYREWPDVEFGTGGITGRVQVKQGYTIESGWKQETGPTGFNRSSAFFFGMRAD